MIASADQFVKHRALRTGEVDLLESGSGSGQVDASVKLGTILRMSEETFDAARWSGRRRPQSGYCHGRARDVRSHDARCGDWDHNGARGRSDRSGEGPSRGTSASTTTTTSSSSSATSRCAGSWWPWRGRGWNSGTGWRGPDVSLTSGHCRWNIADLNDRVVDASVSAHEFEPDQQSGDVASNAASKASTVSGMPEEALSRTRCTSVTGCYGQHGDHGSHGGCDGWWATSRWQR